jgi:O-antigen/teichoic acid export membrane protein
MLKNGLFNATGGIIRIGFGVLTIPVLVRLLGVEEYGIWALTSTVVSIATFTEIGLSNTVTVFLSQDLGRKDYKSATETVIVTLALIIVLSIIAAISLWLGSNSLVSSFFKLHNNEYTNVANALRFSALVVWARMIQQVLIGIEQAHEKYAVINLLITIQSFFINVGMLTIVWLGGKTIEIVYLHVAVNLLFLAIHIVFTLSFMGRKSLSTLEFDVSKLAKIINYSIKIWIGSLGTVLFGQFDKLIVSYLLGAGELGVYAATTSITTQINTFSTTFVQPILPTISNNLAAKNNSINHIENKVKLALQLNVFIALSMGTAMIAFAPSILSLVMGEKYDRSYMDLFQIATLIYTFYSCNAVGYYILLATRAVKEFLIILIPTGVLSLLLIYLGCSHLGLKGAILGNTGYFLSWLLTVVAMKKLNIKFSDWIRWIKFPFILFCVSNALIYIMIVNNQYLIVWMLLISSLFLMSMWFMKSNNLRLSRSAY